MQFAVTAALCVTETRLSILACISIQHFGMNTGSFSNAMFTRFHKALSVRLDFINGDVVYLGVGRLDLSGYKTKSTVAFSAIHFRFLLILLL